MGDSVVGLSSDKRVARRCSEPIPNENTSAIRSFFLYAYSEVFHVYIVKIGSYLVYIP